MATIVAPQIFEKLFSDDAPERFELINGELQAKPIVSIFHSLLMTWLGHLLVEQTEKLTDQELWVLTDPLANIRQDYWLRPDIAVIRAENAEVWKYIMPGHWHLLCVEILSPPDQTIDELLDKCNTKPRWIPPDEALDAGPSLIKLSDLWRGLKNKRGNRTKQSLPF